MTTTATKQTITTQTPQPEQPRASLALASDPSKALRLSPTFQPDVDLLTAEGLIAFGVKGSGKSNLLALLVEQLGRFLLPQLIIDTEREYQSLATLLPHGVLASASRCPSGSDILHKGLQVILDLHSWETDEAAGLALCQLVDELFTATNAIAPQDRVPCVIHLDEAGYWLPQEAVTYLSKETRKALADAFHKLASRGRKQGLTPLLYTQSISEVAKSAIRQAGIKVLMRQTLDVDLTRYCQYIQGATPRTKKAIQAYPSGKAIVILPDGSQHKVQFHQRQSEHVSHTPQAQAALVKFAALAIDVSTLPMRDLTASMQPDQVQKASRQTAQPGKGKQAPSAKTVTEQVHELLAVNPALRVVDLMKLVGCSQTAASRARIAYFKAHPERACTPKTVTEQLYDLLSVNPSLRPADLLRVTGCSSGLASRIHRAYFEKHPQLAPVHHQTATERIHQLLAENPGLRPVDLGKRVGCDPALAGRARLAYFAAHPEREVPVERVNKPGPVAKLVYDLLAENPTLRPIELRKLVGCGKTTASRLRLAYFAAHPQQQALTRQTSRPMGKMEKPRPTVTHQAPRPPLGQEARRRLEEAQGRLTEQGLPVTSEWLAREAHIGYHAVATFLQEQRGVSQSQAEQARLQERPTVL